LTLRELEIPRGFQQPLIVLVALHWDGTKSDRRYNHVKLSLVDLWVAISWV